VSSSAARAPGHRIGSMEGLRGYAVVLVFLVHFMDHYFRRVKDLDFNRFDITTGSNLVDALAYWAWASHYGVDLFFLLSGFLIVRLVARPEFRLGPFLWHRLQRLYPAFGAALVIYVGYHAVFWHKFYDWRTLAANAFFLPGIFELSINAIIVPTWSLSFEWLFYLTTPPMLLALRGRGPLRAWHVVASAALTLAVLLPLGPHYARFVMFFAGALLALAPAERTRAWITKVPEGAIVVAYIAVTTFFVFDQDYRHFAWPYAIVCVTLVAKTIYGHGALGRLFQFSPLRALGNVSYSFYLLHGIALVAVVDHIGPLCAGWPAGIHFAVLLGISFAVSVGASFISYRLLEQWYFERRWSARGSKGMGGRQPTWALQRKAEAITQAE
jgi:exopolysaccharide production protein ExoZ